jgi:membrane protein
MSQSVTNLIHHVASFLVMTLLFAAMFKVLPDAEVTWRSVWVGAAVTALLFVIGKFAIGKYLSISNVGETYQAAGTLVAVLVWVYYSALIVLFGAEFTQAWARRYGEQIVPSEGAVRVVRDAREVREPGMRGAAGA